MTSALLHEILQSEISLKGLHPLEQGENNNGKWAKFADGEVIEVSSHFGEPFLKRGRWFSPNSISETHLNEVVEAQAARIEQLEAALIERDGGVHDHDCKILRRYGPKVCTCGHDEVIRIINKEPRP